MSLGVGVEFVEDGGLRAMYQAREPVGPADRVAAGRYFNQSHHPLGAKAPLVGAFLAI
jgi:hypothetical protein